MQHIELTVDGMTCTGCSNRLQRVLEATDGVQAAHIVLETKQVSIQYDPARIDINALHNAITDTGFSVISA